MTGRLPRGALCALAACALAACALAACLVTVAPAYARGGGGERVEARADGVCGRASSASLRLRAEDGEIRVDMHVDTSRYGVWRLTVLHERRRVGPVKRVRATRAERGFEYRIFLPDFAGPDAVWVRAVAPQGETCTAGTTVSDP
jgi:hypothetical protein